MSKGIVAAAPRAAKRLAEQVERFARAAVEAAWRAGGSEVATPQIVRVFRSQFAIIVGTSTAVGNDKAAKPLITLTVGRMSGLDAALEIKSRDGPNQGGRASNDRAILHLVLQSSSPVNRTSMNPYTPPVNMPPERPHWWGRNWKWFVPTGCLGMLLLVAGFVFVIISIVFGAMKSSDAYKTALAKAQADPRVVNALGSPIKDGFFVSGKTNVSGSSGHADLTVPISGPKGKGTIYFVASKFAGEWTFSKLVVEVGNTGERIDLTERDPRTVP